MTPYHRAFDCDFWVGDVREVAAALAEKSVHVAVTSPPYWALRSYLPTDHPSKAFELGSEPIPDCLGWARGVNCGACFICHMREVAAHVWRVLRDDGTFFVNIGDSYSGSGRGPTGHNGIGDQEKRQGFTGQLHARTLEAGAIGKAWTPVPPGLKPKDRVGIPERLALALQADGWTWRDTIHLCKVAPMPESVRDRTTQAHEPLFVFSKRAKYFWDAEAVREKAEYGLDFRSSKTFGKSDNQDRNDAGRAYLTGDGGRNPRSWMLWSPEPSAVQHYATFPRFIPNFAIRAGSSEYGVCAECGAPWERVTDSFQEPTQKTNNAGKLESNLDNNWDRTEYPRTRKVTTTLGFRPTCQHNAEVVPATVWDPFSGSGTTQRVARELGRHSIYTDLSTAYADMAIGLMEKVTPMLPMMKGGDAESESQLTLAV